MSLSTCVSPFFAAVWMLLLLLLQHSPATRTTSVVTAFSTIVSTGGRPLAARTIAVADPEKKKISIPLDLEITKDRATLGSLIVPHVGIGTIAWSTTNERTDQDGGAAFQELQSLVDTACDNNIGFFDTAERYGSSLKTALGLGWGETEQLTKRLLLSRTTPTTTMGSSSSKLDRRPQSAAQVATKFTPTPWRTTVQSVIDACEDSRQRLGVDQIDLYQLHMPDIVQPFQKFGGGTAKPKDTVYWQGLAECYHRGLVKNIGVSNYGPTLLAKCQQVLSAEGVPLASNQIAYSLLGRHNGSKETLEYCNDNNIRVLAFFPLAMGLLTGKYQEREKTSLSRSSNMNNNGGDSLKVSKKSSIETRDLVAYSKRISPLLAAMQTIAATHSKTVAQVALNYIVCKGAIPIPGARTRQQLVDNAGAMGWRLSGTEIEQLETESDRLGFGFDGAGFKRASEKFVGYGMETWTLD